MQEYHRRSKRSMVPVVCYALAAVLLVAVVVLGAIGVGLPLWATLKPIRGESGVRREVRVGLFDLMLKSTYDNCVFILPQCRLPQGAFSLETGNVTENLLDVNVRECWTHCDDNGQMEIFSILKTTEYLTVLEQRIFNITQTEVVADRTIPVTCRNFIAPRGMIIAGLATACAALVLALMGTKFVVMGGLSGCLCACAFVVQLVGLILAATYSVRPCDRMNESWTFHLGASFIVTLISTALLLVATIFTTCGVFAYSVDKGMKMAAHAARAAEDHLPGSRSSDPLHGGMHQGHGHLPNSHTHLGSEFANLHNIPGSEVRREFRDSTQMQPPYVPSVSGGIQIPIISTPMSGPYGSHLSGLHGIHGPAIVTHTTHTEERTFTQAAHDDRV